MPLNADSTVSRKTGLLSAPLDRDLVILNSARDDYTGLDEIGRRVWDMIDAPSKVRDLCLRVEREYQGDPGQISADLLVFFDALAAADLIDVA